MPIFLQRLEDEYSPRLWSKRGSGDLVLDQHIDFVTSSNVSSKLKLPVLNRAVRMTKKKKMRWPGIEPGSIAWKATMLTTIPPSLIKLVK